jgi:hypothetical protein
LDFKDFDTLFLKLGEDFFNLPFGLRDYFLCVLHCFFVLIVYALRLGLFGGCYTI